MCRGAGWRGHVRERQPSGEEPQTGQLLGAGTASLIGLTIPGSGDFADGIVQAGHGIPLAGYTIRRSGRASRRRL
jgi:hypothetical protein